MGNWITENSQNIVSVIRTPIFLNNGKIDIQNKELIKREIDKKRWEQKQLKRGDIIIEKSGGSPNQPVGRVVFLIKILMRYSYVIISLLFWE